VDFLEQLSVVLPSTEREVEDVLRRKTKTPRKLVLRLIDRKKFSNDGCVVITCHLFLYVPHPGSQYSRYPHTVFPKRKSCKHLTLW
jgi:hypothetical protein